MGTSKAFGGLKGNPTWGSLSRSTTKAVNDGRPTQKAMGNVVSRLITHWGGSSSASSGMSKVGGRAGVVTARRLGSFMGLVQVDGFQTAFSSLPGGATAGDVNQAINVILENCALEAGLQDEVSAKAAIKDLLEDIGSAAETLEELGIKVEESLNDYGQEELLVRYFGFYLYEHLCTDFYEKLIKQKGIRETELFYTDLKEYILERTKTVSKHRALRYVDWRSEYGASLMQEIFKDTLKAFEGYEG